MTTDTHQWARKVLQEIDDHGSGLTSWEVGFVESVTRQLERGVTLTAKQSEQLSKIHDARVGRWV